MATDARTLIVQALFLSLALHLATFALPPFFRMEVQAPPPRLEVEIQEQVARLKVQERPLAPAVALPEVQPPEKNPEPSPEPELEPEPKPSSVEAVRPEPVVTMPAPVIVAVPQSLPSPSTAITVPVMAPVVAPVAPPHSPLPRPVAMQKPAPVMSAPPPLVDTTWYSARQLDVMPKPLGSLQPAYPRQARRDGITGSVVLRLHIDEHGAVDTVEIAESTPPGVFDAAVLKQANGVRFSPGQRDGKPVRATLNVRLRFELED